jgi:hypothetical protein
MRRLFWRAFARMMRWIRGNGTGTSAASNRSADVAPGVASRARFWADFREGQREAELRTKKS